MPRCLSGTTFFWQGSDASILEGITEARLEHRWRVVLRFVRAD